MLSAWGETTEDDEASEEEEKEEEEEEADVALMARSETHLDDEPLDSLAQLKEKVRRLNKAKLKELLFTLVDKCDSINAENCMLKDACSDLKRDMRTLEHENQVLKSERFEVDKKTLVLHEDLFGF